MATSSRVKLRGRDLISRHELLTEATGVQAD
jgi:hypothetical protein